MPDSNLSRVAAWLAEEERKKRGEEGAALEEPEYVDRAYTHVPGGVQYFDQTKTGVTESERPDPTGIENITIAPDRRLLGVDDYQNALKAANDTVDGKGRPPKGKLPFISGTPTHEATKPAFAYMPDMARLPGSDMRPQPLQRSYAGMIDALAPIPRKPSPATTLAKARGRRSVDVKMTTDGVQPSLRVPVDPLATRASATLPPRVASLMKRRREPSGLEAAQLRSNINQLAANLSQAGEYIGAGIAGTRPHPEAFDNLQAQAGQPVEQYQQRHGEQRQMEQDDLALEEAQREAERAAEEMKFKRGRATSEDQLARDRLAQEKAIAEGRLRSDAADRGLRREEMSFRQKEGAELKQQMAEERKKERQSREGELDLQRLGTATSRAPFGEFQRSLESIDRLIPGLPYGVVPDEEPLGLGDRVGRALAPVGGEFFMTDEGKAYDSAIKNLRDLISRMRSGAVLNAQEEQHYLSLIGDNVFSDKRSAARGINEVRQGIAQKLRNAQGGYQNVLPRYEATGATTYRAPIFGAAPTGEEIQMPNGDVYEVLSDGTTRRRP